MQLQLLLAQLYRILFDVRLQEQLVRSQHRWHREGARKAKAAAMRTPLTVGCFFLSFFLLVRHRAPPPCRDWPCGKEPPQHYLVLWSPPTVL